MERPVQMTENVEQLWEVVLEKGQTEVYIPQL